MMMIVIRISFMIKAFYHCSSVCLRVNGNDDYDDYNINNDKDDDADSNNNNNDNNNHNANNFILKLSRKVQCCKSY